MELDARALIASFGSPHYVYKEAEIRRRCRSLRSAIEIEGLHWLYAMKANANPTILGIVKEEGFGIDAVSVGEVLAAIKAGFGPTQIAFNGNNVDDAEMRAVQEAGAAIAVDSITQLERYGRLYPGTKVGVRINPDVGDGHHDHVITGGRESKFGIDHDQVQEILTAANRHQIQVTVIQQHIGSGILNHETMLRAMEVLLDIAPGFPHLQTIDFGGGFGVPYRPDEQEFDLAAFGRAAEDRLLIARKRMHAKLQFRFEPGRYVVATSGTLLVTVTSQKRGRSHTFIGTDSGFHHLIRPTLYGAYHHIENLTHSEAPKERVTIAGNICESGDLFAKDRLLPRPIEGDILAICTTGAYGYSMSSNYNLRPRPAEVLIPESGPPRLIRPRESVTLLLG